MSIFENVGDGILFAAKKLGEKANAKLEEKKKTTKKDNKTNDKKEYEVD